MKKKNAHLHLFLKPLDHSLRIDLLVDERLVANRTDALREPARRNRFVEVLACHRECGKHRRLERTATERTIERVR